MSNQFKLRKYLGLTEDEIKDNEALWRSENGYEKFIDDDKSLDLKNVGVRAEPDMNVDPNAPLDIQAPAEDSPEINTDIPPEGGTDLDAGEPL